MCSGMWIFCKMGICHKPANPESCKSDWPLYQPSWAPVGYVNYLCACVVDDGPAWIDVLTELLISMMSQQSRLTRSVARTVFRLLSQHVTKNALDLIINVSRPVCEVGYLEVEWPWLTALSKPPKICCIQNFRGKENTKIIWSSRSVDWYYFISFFLLTTMHRYFINLIPWWSVATHEHRSCHIRIRNIKVSSFTCWQIFLNCESAGL